MPPIPVGVQKLAAQLARRMPWLARGQHIGALGRLLQRHGLDADAGWSADRVLRVLEQHNRESGQLVPDPVSQRNPLGYLHWLLTAAGAGFRLPALPVGSAVRAESAWRLEDAERRRVLAAEDPALRAAVIAQIRADIAAQQPRVRPHRLRG